jgi:hypothetical protein
LAPGFLKFATDGKAQEEDEENAPIVGKKLILKKGIICEPRQFKETDAGERPFILPDGQANGLQSCEHFLADSTM